MGLLKWATPEIRLRLPIESSTETFGVRENHSLVANKAWVIGGAGHLGAPITKALNQAGARTVCVDLNQRADTLVHSSGLKHTVPALFNADLEPGPFVSDVTFTAFHNQP